MCIPYIVAGFSRKINHFFSKIDQIYANILISKYLQVLKSESKKNKPVLGHNTIYTPILKPSQKEKNFRTKALHHVFIWHMDTLNSENEKDSMSLFSINFEM